MPQTAVTALKPKAALSLFKIGKGGPESQAVTSNATVDYKWNSLSGTVYFTDRTASDPKSLRDVLVTADYAVNSQWKVLTTYDCFNKKYRAGTSWDGKLFGKKTNFKAMYAQLDKKIAGETSIWANSSDKATVVASQDRLLSSKLSLVRGKMTFEPGFNFVSKSPSVIVTKKFTGADYVKGSFDLKSKLTTAEYYRTPLKFTLTTTVGAGGLLKVAKPNLAVTIDRTFSF